jgi:hypothetical protein
MVQLPLHGIAGVMQLNAFSIRCSGTASRPNETTKPKGTRFYKKGLVIPHRLTWSGIDQVTDMLYFLLVSMIIFVSCPVNVRVAVRPRLLR